MSNTSKQTEAFGRLPTHIQQALLITSSILQRLVDKRFANSGKDALISTVPTTNGDDNEDRQSSAC